jgi:hypothetical protein
MEAEKAEETLEPTDRIRRCMNAAVPEEQRGVFEQNLVLIRRGDDVVVNTVLTLRKLATVLDPAFAIYLVTEYGAQWVQDPQS